MRQLPLPVRLRASSVFSSYVAGPNEHAVRTLQARQFGISPVVFLYGPHATGKTHLLQAMCAQTDMQQQAVGYLAVNDLLECGAELLDGSAQLDTLCLDDVDVLLEDMTWNRALFNLHRELEERRGKMILAVRQPPAAFHMPLADLASRILAGTILRLQPLDEAQQLQALRLHATQRGLELPDDALNYLLRRLPRDMTTLCAFLDELDVASLAAQRKLTVPFIKAVLDRKP